MEHHGEADKSSLKLHGHQTAAGSPSKLSKSTDTSTNEAARVAASGRETPTLDTQTTATAESLAPLTTQEALTRLHDDTKEEIKLMRQEFARRSFFSWLLESISFKSELSKMRWPSVLFMTAHVVAHFIVAFILRIDNLATNWIGLQGLILSVFLIFNLSINLWDTKLRFQELLMKAEQVSDLIARCSRDKHLLKRWRQYSWKSANARSLFSPKSPCIHQTLTYRDGSCLNLPDYLLVRGDIIHLFPGERAPGDCISLRTVGIEQQIRNSNPFDGRDKSGFGDRERVTLREDEIFHTMQMQKDKMAAERKEANSDAAAAAAASASRVGGDGLSAHARLKRATKGMDFLMLSSPYVKSVRISLQRSHKRPVNSIEKECFIVSRKYFETYVIPLVFVLSTVVTAIHYGYLDLTDSDQEIKTISIAYLLLRPSLTIMPFLPWMFPCFWMTVNAYGSARLLCCAESQRRQASSNGNSSDWFEEQSPGWDHRKRTQGDMCNLKSSFAPSNFENLLATPTAAGSSDQNRHEEDYLNDLQNKIKFTTLFRTFLDLIMGKSGHVWRSSSLLQVLGCLTSLCCIDKVGILSWSNPTPEKVLVFTKSDENQSSGPTGQHLMDSRRTSRSGDASSTFEQSTKPDGCNLHVNGPMGALFENMSIRGSCQASTSNIHAASMLKHSMNKNRPEILDVSQTFNSYRGFNEPMALHQETRLQFDDPNWCKFLNNLKPLGVAIMMNNCCEQSFGDYFRFYKHICYESILRCNLTPVVKRRCICALSRLIGFSRDAVKNYKYVGQIGAYRLIDPTSVGRGKLLTSSMENGARLKLPFPNMVCNIHRDSTTGSYQASSQGTADIILDSCVEFWNGKQLVPLDESVRKKAMDFYHRTSLTSYCSAFAYTPLLRGHNLAQDYIEMPSEDSKVCAQLRKLANENLEQFFQMQLVNRPAKVGANTEFLERDSRLYPASSQENVQSTSLSSIPVTSSPDGQEQLELDGDFFKVQKVPRRHLSTGDLRDCSPETTDRSERFQNGTKKSAKHRQLHEALDELTDQVFVGMVALQYQACPDFVALVEQLEHACIRFVHFSKENELRSRVFSEKMGLESGWNCHISLQSDTDLDKADKKRANFLSRQTGCILGSIDRPGSQPKAFSPTSRIANILIGSAASEKVAADVAHPQATDLESNYYREGSLASDVATLSSWKSLPSLVMRVIARLSGSQKHHLSQKETLIELPKNELLISSGDELIEEEARVGQKEPTEGTENSSKDDGFDALAFDMSNRAKLPKGIENIRPHLETVDNIPLQVSLFTDCTSELTKEMIEIMQDYGEIVCVIGSASSRINTPVFLQANASIAVEPLMPQCCTQVKTSGRKCARSISQRAQAKRRPASRKPRRAATKVKPAARESNACDKVDSPLLRTVSNPRDRLGIGPAKYNEQPERYNRNSGGVQTNSNETSSSSSSSSSSGSSSSGDSLSSSSSQDHVSDLSQSLSDTESSADESSSCSSHDSDLDVSHEAPDDAAASVKFARGLSSSLVHELPEPSALAGKLASLPCSYNYNRKEPVNLYSLIMEARHFTFKMKNTFVCMICFALSISSAQFLASILFLPPMLSSGLTIWLTVVVVPLMSFSLMSTTMDSQVMKIAVGKNLQLKPENITFFVICYLIKFIPSIIVVVLNFGLIIAHSCKLTGFGSSSLGPCWMFTYVRHANSSSKDDTGEEDLLWSSHLLTAQVSAAFLMVLYFVVISSGFVHRSHLMWQRSPTRNHLWVIISLTLIFGQLLINQLVLQVNLKSLKIPYEFLASLPLHIWLISFMWPILVIGINLIVKRAEIKATIRQQRRARFDFNTKLGMNSPF